MFSNYQKSILIFVGLSTVVARLGCKGNNSHKKGIKTFNFRIKSEIHTPNGLLIFMASSRIVFPFYQHIAVAQIWNYFPLKTTINCNIDLCLQSTRAD